MTQETINIMHLHEELSLSDISEKISLWVTFVLASKQVLVVNKQKLETSEYWQCMPYALQLIFDRTIKYCGTIIEDIDRIVKAIESDKIRQTEITLLTKIGTKSIGYDGQFGHAYNFSSTWKDYGNSDFKLVEQMYEEGRSLFVTLKDACAIAARLGDYMDNKNESNNITFVGDVINSQIQQGNIHSRQQNVEGNLIFNDDSILDQLTELEKSLQKFELNSDDKYELERKIEEVRVLVSEKDEPAIKISLSSIVDFTKGIGASVLSHGIIQLLSNLFK